MKAEMGLGHPAWWPNNCVILQYFTHVNIVILLYNHTVEQGALYVEEPALYGESQ